MRDKLKEKDRDMDDHVQRIKEKGVAAVILAETRNLDKGVKSKLRKLAEEIYSEWRDELDEVERYKSSLGIAQNDITRVVTLSVLEFDEKGRQFLRQFYEEGKSEGISAYYKHFVVGLCNFYKNLVEAASSKDLDSYSKVLNEKSDE